MSYIDLYRDADRVLPIEDHHRRARKKAPRRRRPAAAAMHPRWATSAFPSSGW
jgi:hypothetical protein